MEIIIKRYRIRPESTDGVMLIDGQRFCDTAEPTLLMVPPGKYKVTFRKHPKQHHRAPYATPMEGSSKVSTFITHGNGVYHPKRNDILIGEHIVPGCLKCSKDRYFIPLCKRLEKVFARNREEVTLTITEL